MSRPTASSASPPWAERLIPRFSPGSNRKGRLACADWRFLLPGIEADAVLLLGTPPPGTVESMARIAELVVVASHGDPGTAGRDSACGPPAGAVVPVRISGRSPLPFRRGAFDLIAAFGREGRARLRSVAAAEELARTAGDGAAVYLESTGPLESWRARHRARALRRADFGPPRFHWLAPGGGRIHLALPLGDREVARNVFDRVLPAVSAKKRMLRAAGRLMSRLRLLEWTLPRQAVVLSRRDGEGRVGGVPRYLAGLAEEHGLELDGARAAFYARGAYDSSKVAFLCFRRGASRPEVLVKITRSPEFNPRLENAYRSLECVSAGALAAEGTYPEPLFLSHHGGLAVLAERFVPGVPFRRRTDGTPDCRFAGAAIDWIGRLGERSSSASEGMEIEDLRAVLQRQLERFRTLYGLSAQDGEFLATRIESLRGVGPTVPAVFQHGDPGTWNLLVGPDDRVIVLDWEAAVPRGVPFWDLLYFLRSLGNWGGRAGHRRYDPTARYARTFLAPSPFARLQADTIRRYRARVGLDARLTEPLFYFCWVHRALKEAARLPAHALETGTYFNLVRLCIRRRTAEGLRWIFD